MQSIPAHSNPASFHPASSGVRSADGTPLHVVDWGEGQPVVFLHAWAVHCGIWEYPMTALAEAGYRVVGFDRRGHGRSPDPGAGFDYATLAADLSAVLESLDLREVVLVGHSMGCAEIATYMARHGHDRIARVVFVGSPGPDADGGLLEPFLDGLRQDRPGFVASGIELFTGRSIPAHSAMAQWIMSMFLQTSPFAMRQCLRLAMQAPLRPVLKALRKPALLVHGALDALNPLDRTGALTASLIPGSRLVVLDDAPHGLPVTHHKRLTAELLSFLSH